MRTAGRLAALGAVLATALRGGGCDLLRVSTVEEVEDVEVPQRVAAISIDEEHGSVAGVELGVDVAEAVVAFGEPAARGADEPAWPLGALPGRATPNIALPPGDASHEVLRYPDLALLVADGHVFAAIVTGDVATASGVGTGSSLAEARAAYPALECASVQRSEPLFEGAPVDEVERCHVRLDSGLRLGLVGDPIESIVLSTTGLGI